ncbi:hypothetical protein ACFE04_018259 [Oxalis oulophora]
MGSKLKMESEVKIGSETKTRSDKDLSMETKSLIGELGSEELKTWSDKELGAENKVQSGTKHILTQQDQSTHHSALALHLSSHQAPDHLPSYWAPNLKHSAAEQLAINTWQQSSRPPSFLPSSWPPSLLLDNRT